MGEEKTETKTPDEIYQQIVDHITYNHPNMVAGGPDENWARFTKAEQEYLDRREELQKQLFEAVPADAPSWVRASVHSAWYAARLQAESWRTNCERNSPQVGATS